MGQEGYIWRQKGSKPNLQDLGETSLPRGEIAQLNALPVEEEELGFGKIGPYPDREHGP
jgi:hypothetical protein